MKAKYSFEVHSYAPELNRIFIGSTDVTRKFPEYVAKSLTKDYRLNMQRVRRYLNRICYNHFIVLKYVGENSGFKKERHGGFNSWEQAMMIIRDARNFFVTEIPKREVRFLYSILNNDRDS